MNATCQFIAAHTVLGSTDKVIELHLTAEDGTVTPAYVADVLYKELQPIADECKMTLYQVVETFFATAEGKDKEGCRHEAAQQKGSVK
jgi:hypothetical protein